MPIHPFTRRHFLAGSAAASAAACMGGHLPGKPPPRAWRMGPEMPLAVQEVYPNAHAGGIHLAGGFIASGGRITGPTDRHVRYQPASETWVEAPSLPVARHHPHLVSFRGDLLVIAGFESPGPEAVWTMQRSGWVLATGEGTGSGAWRDLPPLPLGCGEAVTAVGNGAVHLAGGRTPQGTANANWNDHVDTGHHFVLSEIEGRWDTAAPLPTPRNSAASGVIDGAWHVVGGRTVSGGNNDTHEVYEFREDRWRQAAPMPQAQGGLAAAVVNRKLYVFGGEFFDNGGGVYPESWVYDPDRDAWDALPDMPRPRHGLGAVALGKDIHVIGGALEAGGNATSAAVDILTVG